MKFQFAFLIGCTLLFTSHYSYAQQSGRKEAPSIGRSADTAKKKQKNGEKLNMVMGLGLKAGGMALMMAGQSQEPPNQPMINAGMMMMMMGGLNLGQSSNLNDTAGSAAYTGSLTDIGQGFDTPEYTTADEQKLAKDIQKKALKVEQGKAKLKEMGFELREGDGTLVTPDGTVVKIDPEAARQNPEAFGMSAGDLSRLDSEIAKMGKDLESEYKSIFDDIKGIGEVASSGGGGGSSSGSSYSGITYDSSGAGGKSDESKRKIAAAATVEGLAKKYGDSMIGVANDDIFLMIQRRYNLKKKQNTFIIAP